MSKFIALSGYRILWVMALFDLPVLTKAERKRATKFRAYLLDEGFSMMQFSCYLRFTAGKEQAEALTRRIGRAVPKAGKVDVIWFTDKQYEGIQSYRGQTDTERPSKPDQLLLF
ncbi:CRISPR-associated endonuclease Cas2 [Microvirga sp. W0021]|uniref:CRISPR-associated endoribonuclease Cas2 n=1 Tax=Hohaiivirga grylli TaxID=3133970 RepID=A0ABV0BIB2_9HYPH